MNDKDVDMHLYGHFLDPSWLYSILQIQAFPVLNTSEEV